MKYEFNPLCPCKQCTGKGLGWIKHLTPQQAQARLDRLQREREWQIAKDNYETGIIY